MLRLHAEGHTGGRLACAFAAGARGDVTQPMPRRAGDALLHWDWVPRDGTTNIGAARARPPPPGDAQDIRPTAWSPGEDSVPTLQHSPWRAPPASGPDAAPYASAWIEGVSVNR